MSGIRNHAADVVQQRGILHELSHFRSVLMEPGKRIEQLPAQHCGMFRVTPVDLPTVQQVEHAAAAKLGCLDSRGNRWIETYEVVCNQSFAQSPVAQYKLID